MSVLEIKNLSFSYDGMGQVLNELSFSVEQGSYVFILGPNGVGKSTLMRCILGLGGRFRGEILLEGRDVRSFSPRQLANRAAYIPQSSVHSFNYTVHDVVLMGTSAALHPLSSPGKAQETAAHEAMERLGIEGLSERGYREISGGERQLTLIARALAQQAKLLLMDEPTANLDYGNRVRVLREIRRLTREGYTVLQSTHDPDQAFFYADSVLALSDGMLAAFGGAELLSEELLKKLYGVDIRIEKTSSGRFVCVPEEA